MHIFSETVSWSQYENRLRLTQKNALFSRETKTRWSFALFKTGIGLVFLNVYCKELFL